MTTTPTLRDAAQAVLNLPRGTSGRIILEAHDEAMLRAALAAPADALAEPVATVYTMEALVPGGSVKYHATVHKPLPAGTKLYTAPPATQLQQAVTHALAPIQQAIRDYHYALDTRQHGGHAGRHAFGAICEHLGMHWVQGEEAAIRAKGQQ